MSTEKRSGGGGGGADSALTTENAANTPTITLPAPRRKARVREVPGVAVPTPSALPHAPDTHYEAFYCQGHITVRDPRQAAALWHNGYYGHRLEGDEGGGSRGRGGVGQKKKKWRLVEADGLQHGRWFKEMREKERREYKGGGMEGLEEMEEEEEEGDYVENREEESYWEEEEEEEEMEEVEEEEEENDKLMNEKREGEEEERENETNEETEEKESESKIEEDAERKGDKEDIEKKRKGENYKKHRKPKSYKRDEVEKDDNEDNKEDDETEPWRTVLTLSTDQEAKPSHQDPYAYLTLLPEEALFLSYALGCLVLTHESPSERSKGKRALTEDSTHKMTIDEMWRTFLRDDPAFAVKYAAYHHLRTQGWVVKAGIKYGVDYVLYPVGPPFYHSQYAVRVHCLWADTLTMDHSFPGHQMTWTTVATMERLTNHVNKTPVLCLVLRPRSTTDDRLTLIDCLKELKVQMVVLSRWNPTDGSR